MNGNRSHPKRGVGEPDGRRAARARAVCFRRIRRRRVFLKKAAALLPPDALSPEESFQLLFGSLSKAREALKRARRRVALRRRLDPLCAETSASVTQRRLVVRPKRILSRLNRAAVFPPLVLNPVQVEAVAVTEVLDALYRDHRFEPPHRLLDAFVISSGFAWRTGAELILACKLIANPIDIDVIEATSRARAFWTHYDRGRSDYATLVAKNEIAALEGDWAWFDHDDFELLLPQAVIPSRLRRHEYLTNWHCDGLNFILDVHTAPKAAPLFQHPFPTEFDSLFFGKPRRKFPSDPSNCRTLDMPK